MNSHPRRAADAVRLIHAPLVADGASVLEAPGAIVVRGDRVVGVGSPSQIGGVAGAIPEVLPSSAVIPALVNAHAHLDLTAVGCQPYDGDFDAWLAGVRDARLAMTAADVDASVQQGVTALRAGGVAAVADIAGRHAPEASLRRLAAAGVSGCSFTELFGMGPGRTQAIASIEAIAGEAHAGEAAWRDAMAPGVVGGSPHTGPGRLAPLGRPRRGLQPHAPYSAAAEVYLAALRAGLPVATHLAESPEEAEFLQLGTGRFKALLERLGLWDPTMKLGARHPVDWAAALLSQVPGARLLCAHCNCVDDGALELLCTRPFAVVYCPRASETFRRSGHRYREMLSRGMAVALGTDSMISLDTPDRLSTLDDARLLMRRDELPLQTALAMATTHGAAALDLPISAFTLAPSDGPKAGILQVPLNAAETGKSAVIAAFATSRSAPVWLAG